MWLNIQIYKRLCEEGQMPGFQKEDNTALTRIKKINDKALSQMEEDNKQSQRIRC